MAVQDVINDEPSQSPGSMFLAKCILKSSAVLHAVQGHIRSPTTDDLVLGKETAIELLVLVEDGSVQSVCEQLVFGTIKDMKLLPWNEQHHLFDPQTYGKDLLVLLSDSGKLSFLTFNLSLHRFLAVKHIHLSAPGNYLRDLGWSLAIESRGHAIAVAAFEDQVAVFSTISLSESKPSDKGILYPEEHCKSLTAENGPTGWGTIWSTSFITTLPESNSSIDVGTELVLAVLLYRKGSVSNEVQVLVCNSQERTIQLIAFYNLAGVPFSNSLAFHILEIPAVFGFLLLFRPGDIVLMDVSNPSNPQTCAVVPLSSFMEDEGAHYSMEEEGTHLGEEEKNFSVAASALLELCTRAREGTEHVSFIKSGRSEAGIANMEGPASFCRQVPYVYSWSWEPVSVDHRARLVLGSNTGEICLATFFPGGSEKLKISLSECLYKTSPCNALLWTKGGFIAAMVEMGDGQILRLVDGKIVQQNLIQKLAPILDFSLGDYYGEKQDQMFAACGVGEEGSVRVIRNGVSVEKLLSTPPLYPGVTGIWTMPICQTDQHHAFLVISFVEETRVLSVGLNFVDITEAVGFHPSSNTLACGLLEDGWVTQVCSTEVYVCAPTKAAHPAGSVRMVPMCSSWKPHDYCVSLGAVASQKLILAMSRPGLLVLLSTSMSSAGVLELVETQRCYLEAEVSCISIPQEDELVPVPVPPSIIGLLEGSKANTFPNGVEVGKVCVVGTHKPSVELLSIVPGEMFSSVAMGQVSLVSSVGTAMNGCVPQDVRLVLFDRLYILTGLRNGMLLRYEWPDNCLASTVPIAMPPFTIYGENFSRVSNKSGGCESSCMETCVQLNLIAIRRIGVSPVSLIPLQASLRADIIALSDRPWLLQTGRHSQRIAYTSISFQPSTHVTPVSSLESPKGILFVADCSLHLVEMEHSKRLNVQKLPVRSTPRRVLYHSVTKSLLVMRTEIIQEGYSSISDVICVDPLSGTTHSYFKFENGEVAKCMQLWNTGNDEVLLVGTAMIGGRILLSSGEAERAKGRVIIFHLEPKYINSRRFASYTSCSAGSSSSFGSSSYCSDQATNDICEEDSKHGHKFAEGDYWALILKNSVGLPGVVLSVTPYMDQYVLASAGNSLICLGFLGDSAKRLRRLDSIKTRFLITSITTHLSRIAVGDCRDGVLIYTYREDVRKLEQLYCDPVQRLVADCLLLDFDTPIATDRRGNFCALACPSFSEEGTSPEHNLTISCWYHIGEISMSIRKGSFAYKAPMDEHMKVCSSTGSILNDISEFSVVVSTVLGSVFVFIRLTREEYDLLEVVQTRLAQFPLTAPLLGNDHARFRGQGCPVGVKKVLDGDMLGQFLELTSALQETVLKEQFEYISDALSPMQLGLRLPMERVLRLLERLHNSLT